VLVVLVVLVGVVLLVFAGATLVEGLLDSLDGDVPLAGAFVVDVAGVEVDGVELVVVEVVVVVGGGAVVP